MECEKVREGLTRAFAAVVEVRIGSKEIQGAYLHRRGAQTRHIPRTKLMYNPHERHGQEVPTQCRDGIIGGPGGSEQSGGGEGITH